MRRGRIELTHELGRFQSRAIFSLGGLFYLGAAQPPDKNRWLGQAQFSGRNQDTSHSLWSVLGVLGGVLGVSHSLLTFFLHRTKDRDASTVTN